MSEANIQLSSEAAIVIGELAASLKQTPSEVAEMALEYFFQSGTYDNAVIAVERYSEDNELVSYQAAEGEDEIGVSFHQSALAEFEELDEDDQSDILEMLIDRLAEEEIEEDEGIDICLREANDKALILSKFEFGEIVYELGEQLTIFLIDFPLEEEDEDFAFDEEAEAVDHEEV